jgi:hypothetical protein
MLLKRINMHIAVLFLAAFSVFCPERSDIFNDMNTLEIIPNFLNFNEVLIGSESQSITFTIKNNGGTVITVSSLVLGGTNPAEFIVADNPPYVIDPGVRAFFSASFKPTRLGIRTASLSAINSTGDDFVVSMMGTGIGQPLIEFSPLQHDFGSVKINIESAQFPIMIKDNGSDDIIIYSISLEDMIDFVLYPPPTPLTITGGGSTALFYVTFRPSKAGTCSTRIYIHSNLGDDYVDVSGLGTVSR